MCVFVYGLFSSVVALMRLGVSVFMWLCLCVYVCVLCACVFCYVYLFVLLNGFKLIIRLCMCLFMVCFRLW